MLNIFSMGSKWNKTNFFHYRLKRRKKYNFSKLSPSSFIFFYHKLYFSVRQRIQLSVSKWMNQIISFQPSDIPVTNVFIRMVFKQCQLLCLNGIVFCSLSWFHNKLSWLSWMRHLVPPLWFLLVETCFFLPFGTICLRFHSVSTLMRHKLHDLLSISCFSGKTTRHSGTSLWYDMLYSSLSMPFAPLTVNNENNISSQKTFWCVLGYFFTLKEHQQFMTKKKTALISDKGYTIEVCRDFRFWIVQSLLVTL